MTSLLSQVSPTVVTAVTVGATVTAVAYWYMFGRSRRVASRFGVLVLTPKPSSIDEYKRDFERFKQYGGIEGLRTDSSVDDYKRAYCLSTSFGMDVLIALGINPPVVHQPLFVVGGDPEFGVSFYGFIGQPKGSRPDKKFSNQVLIVRTDDIFHDKTSSVRVSYEIKSFSDGNGPENIRDCF